MGVIWCAQFQLLNNLNQCVSARWNCMQIFKNWLSPRATTRVDVVYCDMLGKPSIISTRFNFKHSAHVAKCSNNYRCVITNTTEYRASYLRHIDSNKVVCFKYNNISSAYTNPLQDRASPNVWHKLCHNWNDFGLLLPRWLNGSVQGLLSSFPTL